MKSITNSFEGLVSASAWLAAGLAFILAVPAALAQQADESGYQSPDDADYKALPAEIMPRAPYELLLDVDQRGDEGFVAVGARGHVLLSEDGKAWEQSPVPTRATLTAVDFVDAKHGWAVGHAAAIIATDDGGKTWALQNFEPELEQPFLDVLFFDRNKGFAIGAYDMFYKTEDGGKTWTEYEEPLSLGEWHLNSIVQLGDGTLVIAGETGLLSRSTDGGETWNLIDGPYSGSYFGVKPLGEKGVLLFGLRGNAFLTTDISEVPTLPPDTDLGYKFKQPPTIGAGPEEELTAEEKAKAKAEAEREAARERAAKSAWKLIENGQSILSLMGGTTLDEGGYVLVGINGVIWEATDTSGKVKQLPNTYEGGLAAVAETQEGNLVLVGENGAYLYKRD